MFTSKKLSIKLRNKHHNQLRVDKHLLQKQLWTHWSLSLFFLLLSSTPSPHLSLSLCEASLQFEGINYTGSIVNVTECIFYTRSQGRILKLPGKKKNEYAGFFFCSSSEPVSEADKVRRRICDHVTGNVEKDRRQHYFMSVGHVHLIT